MLGLLSVLKKYKNTRFSSEMIRKQRKLRGDLVQKSPTPTNGVEPKIFQTLKEITTFKKRKFKSRAKKGTRLHTY